jgi:hypothetical protein
MYTNWEPDKNIQNQFRKELDFQYVQLLGKFRGKYFKKPVLLKTSIISSSPRF